MAPTKRKRRSKHRGTAAGTIQTRGRTGRKPTAEELGRKPAKGAKGAGGRQARFDREPTWGAATTRALFAAVLLFVLTQVGLFGSDLPVASALLLSLLAVLIYIPLGYWTDRALYNWRQKRISGGSGK
jgi:hypothetical protein